MNFFFNTMENQNLEENFKLFYRIAKALILELNDEGEEFTLRETQK